MAFDFGPITIWKTPDGILWAKNTLCTLAYAVTDDQAILNSVFRLGIVNGIIIGWIDAERAKLWDGCECRPS